MTRMSAMSTAAAIALLHVPATAQVATAQPGTAHAATPDPWAQADDQARAIVAEIAAKGDAASACAAQAASGYEPRRA